MSAQKTLGKAKVVPSLAKKQADKVGMKFPLRRKCFADRVFLQFAASVQVRFKAFVTQADAKV